MVWAGWKTRGKAEKKAQGGGVRRSESGRERKDWILIFKIYKNNVKNMKTSTEYCIFGLLPLEIFENE